MKRILLILMILVNVFVLASCNDQNTNENNNQNNNNGNNTNEPSKPSHTHSYDDEVYFADEENHWYECSCGDKSDEEEHSLVEFEEYGVSYCEDCLTVVTEENYYTNISSLGVDSTEVHNAYQVLVYSYYDSDGDGYGDLAGLESKLEYIQELGCDVIWLSPIMESESYHAYDITSFYRIDSKIGTLDDYLSLVDTAHEMGMKIMLDMPINHTSPNHEWFIEYLNGNSDYNEYYQEKQSGVNYGTSSSMGAKATFYTAENGKTYFAAFGATMPDLNYQSDVLKEAIFEVFDFWSILGADGYRFDAVKHIYDPNEIPANENSVTLNNELFQELRDHLKGEYPNIYLLGENFSGQGEVLQYAESFDAEFDFESWHTSLGAVTNQDPWGQGERRKYWDDTIVGCTNELIDTNPDWIATFMTGNHDVTRAGSYIGDKVNDDEAALKLYAALCTLRQGIPFIYYGDEIGMFGENKSGDGKVEDSQIRLPMNFSDSTIDLPTVFYSKLDNGSILGNNMLADWSTYKTDNPIVEDQMDDPSSLYNTYKELLQFRKDYPAIALGDMFSHSDYANQGTIIGFDYEGETIYVAFNFSESELEITDLSFDGDLEILLSINGADTDGYGLELAARGVAVFTVGYLEQGSAIENFDANYGLVIYHTDGSETIIKLKPVDEFEGFSQHFGDDVVLQNGDVIKLINFYDNNTIWTVTKLNSYGLISNFSTTGNELKCTNGGTYDFYIKFKMNQDEIYIGPAS